MTMIEMLIAMAVIVIIFATVAPQIKCIQNSWASKRENASIIQNGRVLMDHIARNLSEAGRIVAVSSPAEPNGFIEFEDSDGNTMRY